MEIFAFFALLLSLGSVFVSCLSKRPPSAPATALKIEIQPGDLIYKQSHISICFDDGDESYIATMNGYGIELFKLSGISINITRNSTVRKLITPLNVTQIYTLKKYIVGNYNLFRFASNILKVYLLGNIGIRAKETKDAHFCSSFVTSCLKQIGLLPQTLNEYSVTPWHFAKSWLDKYKIYDKKKYLL